MADRAAKRGARRVESQTLDLKLGLADIYSKLSRRVWGKRGEDFRAQATAKEWLQGWRKPPIYTVYNITAMFSTCFYPSVSALNHAPQPYGLVHGVCIWAVQ